MREKRKENASTRSEKQVAQARKILTMKEFLAQGIELVSHSSCHRGYVLLLRRWAVLFTSARRLSFFPAHFCLLYLTTLSWLPVEFKYIIMRNARRLRRSGKNKHTVRRNENSNVSSAARPRRRGLSKRRRHNLKTARECRGRPPYVYAFRDRRFTPRHIILIFNFSRGVTYFCGSFLQPRCWIAFDHPESFESQSQSANGPETILNIATNEHLYYVNDLSIGQR